MTGLVIRLQNIRYLRQRSGNGQLRLTDELVLRINFMRIILSCVANANYLH